MIYDWYANASSDHKELINELSGAQEVADEKLKALLDIDPDLAYNILAIYNKDRADELRRLWANSINIDYKRRLQEEWRLYDFFEQNFAMGKIDLRLLPRYSFKICFEFELEKPYISKGGQDFYIIDNPLSKDMVFDLPCVNPTVWKGNLRSALWHEGYREHDEAIVRLFGSERTQSEDAVFSKGRLHFIPTFFWKRSLEIINPHDRKRRVGTKPILFECVPPGVAGSFTLVYVPLASHSDGVTDIAKDMELVGKGVNAMFTKYGFGAKTSDGFGIANDGLKAGCLDIKAKINDIDEVEKPEEVFLRYLDETGMVKKECIGNGEFGLLSNKEFIEKKDQLGGGSQAEFKRFRNWYKRWGDRWQEHLRAEAALSGVGVCQRTFNSFNEMEQLMVSIGTILIKQGE